MKATELLKTQHQVVNDLFARLEQAEGEEKRALVNELVTNLVAHSTIEKEIFYPACQQAMSDGETLLEAFEEHAVVEFALQKLLSASQGDESLHAKVTVLKELVQHHVEEEETELLKQAETALGERDEELGTMMEAQFELLKGQDVAAILAQSLAAALPSMTRTTTRKTARRSGAKASGSKRGGAKRGGAKRTGSRSKATRSTSGRTTGSRSKTGSSSRSGGTRKSTTGDRGKSTRASSTTKARGGRRTGGRTSASR